MQEIGITKRQKPFRPIAVVALGCALTVGGIIGLFVPFVPGDLLIGAGVLLLSAQYAWLRQALEKWRARFPLVEGKLVRFSARCKSLWNKLMNHLGDSGLQSGAFRSAQTKGQGMQQATQNTETPNETRKVLVFDEDIDDLARHAEPFETHGFEVYKCMSIETGMRCIEREELDFALIDQVSPAFEGLRVVRHLVRYNLRTPFIVLARCKDIRCHQQALALGAMDYLEKPVPNAKMNRLIERYFGTALPKPVCLL